MTRSTYIWDSELQKMVPKDQFIDKRPLAPMVMPDIKGYQSMATGEWVGSRSTHREHLKRNHLVEIGNEKVTPKRIEPDRAAIRRAVETATRHILG